MTPIGSMIDSELADGSLTYGEYVHHGATDDEVLFSAHICHPSLANDNCSGLAMLTAAGGAAQRPPDPLRLPLRVCPRHHRPSLALARNEALT